MALESELRIVEGVRLGGSMVYGCWLEIRDCQVYNHTEVVYNGLLSSGVSVVGGHKVSHRLLGERELEIKVMGRWEYVKPEDLLLGVGVYDLKWVLIRVADIGRMLAGSSIRSGWEITGRVWEVGGVIIAEGSVIKAKTREGLENVLKMENLVEGRVVGRRSNMLDLDPRVNLSGLSGLSFRWFYKVIMTEVQMYQLEDIQVLKRTGLLRVDTGICIRGESKPRCYCSRRGR